MQLALSETQLPLRLRLDTPLSEEELMRFCAANDIFRIEREPNGELTVMTPAGNDTSRMNGRITRLLDEWAESDGRGVAFDATGGFTLRDGSMRNPDGAWILLPRWQALTKAQQASFAPIYPDFIIELRSPSDRLRDLQMKMQQWIANGVQVAWLIDPRRKVVAIYRPGQAPEVHEDPTSVQGDGPIRGFELVLSRVWSSP
jgi:Uma2 family endonuclease